MTATTTPGADAAQAVAHYRHHGWAVVADVFDSDEVEAIAEVATRLALDELARRPDPSRTATVDSSGALLAPRKLDWAYTQHPALRAFALDERLTSLISHLLGRDGYLARDQVFLKPPRVGSAKPLHQDHTHFRCAPADWAVTAWIALDDADEDNGCLRYIDGSHSGPAYGHTPQAHRPHDWVPAARQLAGVERAREVAIPMAKGSVSFHHPKTLHRSGPNRSDRWRRAHSSQWVAAGVRCDGDLLEWAYSHTVGRGRHAVKAP